MPIDSLLGLFVSVVSESRLMASLARQREFRGHRGLREKPLVKGFTEILNY